MLLPLCPRLQVMKCVLSFDQRPQLYCSAETQKRHLRFYNNTVNVHVRVIFEPVSVFAADHVTW